MSLSAIKWVANHKIIINFICPSDQFEYGKVLLCSSNRCMIAIPNERMEEHADFYTLIGLVLMS